MSKKEKKNLQDWLKGNREMPSKDIDSIWDLSGQYKSGYHPDVEGGLSRLKARMKQSGKTSRVVPLKSNRRIFLRFAAAVALILAIGFTWKTLLYESRINEITENDQQKELFLADGTLVVLNQNSKLEYPESFSGQQRVVKLSGEAYFNVAHNPEQPFLILTEESSVKVLGTSFNLRAYPSETFTEVEVESGKVAFSVNNSNSSLTLTANEKGSLSA
jgi:transmembrane sensor